jgi:nucleoid-associated protein YgaU
MKLEKLKIIPYKDEKFNDKVNNGIELMINPASYKLQSSIGYAENKAKGRSARSPKFATAGQDTLDFETTYDGTGAVQTGASPPATVKSQIDQLKSTVYVYDGTIHQPNFLKVVWGGILFKCRLSSLSIDYKLFAPSGMPLRAKVNLRFYGFVSAEEESLTNNQSSPDMTHLITVKAGDSLPLLCYKIYNDSSYYHKVAKINGISNFRNIQPGTLLEFPPIRK